MPSLLGYLPISSFPVKDFIKSCPWPKPLTRTSIIITLATFLASYSWPSCCTCSRVEFHLKSSPCPWTSLKSGSILPWKLRQKKNRDGIAPLSCLWPSDQFRSSTFGVSDEASPREGRRWTTVRMEMANLWWPSSGGVAATHDRTAQIDYSSHQVITSFTQCWVSFLKSTARWQGVCHLGTRNGWWKEGSGGEDCTSLWLTTRDKKQWISTFGRFFGQLASVSKACNITGKITPKLRKRIDKEAKMHTSIKPQVSISKGPSLSPNIWLKRLRCQ